MGTGKRRGDGSDDGRRARKVLRVPGLLDALDYLDEHGPAGLRGRVWDDVGRKLRTRPGALIDRLKWLIANEPERYEFLWEAIDGALVDLADAIRRRLRGDS